jgi:hypothetical protein
MALPTGQQVADPELASTLVGDRDVTPARPAVPPQLAPLAPDRHSLRLSFSQGTRDKLEYARALLSHRIPSGDLEAVLDRVLDLAIPQLERGKFAATDRPRPRREKCGNRRAIPAAVRREVWERDQGRCTFTGDGAHRCGARTRVEFDHLEPVARGGQGTVANVTLRCRTHNQLAAERTLGAGFMEHKREQARAAARATHEHHAAAEREAAARELAKQQAQDLFAGLRSLGCRTEDARRAVAHCMTLPASSLEERMRAALMFIAPKRGTQRVAAAPG